MSSAILAVRDRLLRIQKEAKKIVKEEAIKSREVIAKLNREQLLEGKRSDGADMPDYVPDSKQPSAPGKITLFDTGDFHEGIEPMFSQEGIEMIGVDDKTPFLIAKYPEILGLNKESRIKLVAHLKPRVIKRIKEL